MGKGFLSVQLYSGDYALHGQRMAVQITKDDKILHNLETDENGATEIVSLEAPDLTSPAPGADLFETYDVIVPEANGYKKTSVYGVQIFDGVTSVLNIHLEALSEVGPQEIKIYVPRERGASISYETDVPGSYLAMPTWEVMTQPIYSKGASIRHLRTQMPGNIAAGAVPHTFEDEAFRQSNPLRPLPDSDMMTLLLALILLMR